MNKQGFDRETLRRRYEAFNAAYEDENDKSGGRGVAKIFKEYGPELLASAEGLPRWHALHDAIKRADRGAVATIVNDMLNASAA